MALTYFSSDIIYNPDQVYGDPDNYNTALGYYVLTTNQVGGNDTFIVTNTHNGNDYLAAGDANDMYGKSLGGNDIFYGGAGSGNEFYGDALNLYGQAKAATTGWLAATTPVITVKIMRCTATARTCTAVRKAATTRCSAAMLEKTVLTTTWLATPNGCLTAQKAAATRWSAAAMARP